MNSFWTALQFLTIFPWPRGVITAPEEIGRSAVFFPLVGFCLGLGLVFFDWFLSLFLAPDLLGVALVALMILLTRGLHLDGLGDTFDGLGAKGGRDGALRAMADSRVGIFGLLAVVVVLSFKFQALKVLGEHRAPALLLAPVLGRWAMLILAYGSSSAREGLGRILVDHVNRKILFWATAFTLISVSLLKARPGLWIALCVTLLTLLFRRYLQRRLGGVTGDTFGAVGEINETLALVIFASA